MKPARAPDKTGLRFDMLTVIERAGSAGKHSAWRCRCYCGKVVVKSISYLNRSDREHKHCGCQRNQITGSVMHKPAPLIVGTTPEQAAADLALALGITAPPARVGRQHKLMDIDAAVDEIAAALGM